MKKLSNDELQNVSGGFVGELIFIGVVGYVAYQAAKHGAQNGSKWEN